MFAVIVTVTVQSELNFADFRTGGVRPIEQKTQGTRKKKKTVKKVQGLHVGNMAKSKRNHSTNRNKHGHERVFLERKRAKNRRAKATLER